MGTALHPLIWSAGALAKKGEGWCVPCGSHAFLPGPAGTWGGEWIALAAATITADEVGTWPYSVGILVKWVAFLSSLHWLAAGADLGVGGVSFVEMLILFCMSCGLVRGWSWKRPFPVSESWAPNFGVGCSVWSRH